LKSLFSQAGYAAYPETFEHLVMGKHCLSRIYCSQNKARKEFLERWKKDAWSKKEDRDDVAFWEQQKKEYLEMNPTHALAIALKWKQTRTRI
jgi:hypothetical protein